MANIKQAIKALEKAERYCDSATVEQQCIWNALAALREGEPRTDANFSSDTFEHDYIVCVMSHMVTDLKTAKPVEQIIDKYATELTAFMNGQIVQAVRTVKTLSAR